MPLDFKQAASNMIDSGATDDDIKGVLGNLKKYGGDLMDQGKSDAEIESLVGKTKWKDAELFKVPAPAAHPLAPPRDAGSEWRAVGNFAKKAAIPTILGGIGGLAGTALGGPGVGTAAGAGGGGALGEGINQALGITEPSVADIAISAVAPSALRGAGQVGKAIIKPAARLVPGVSAVLKQPIVQEARNLPQKFLPKQSSKSLYGEVAGLEDTNVLFPKTIALQNEMEAAEATLMPGLQSAVIKRGERGGAEALSSGRTAKLIKEPGKGYTGAMSEAIPDAGVPFKVGQDHVRRLGAQIRSAESGITQENAGALKKLRASFMEEMDTATEHIPKLKAANATFKTEQAVDEMTSIFEGAFKKVAGKRNIDDFNAKQVLDKFNKITNSKNPNDYDKLFTDGLGHKNLTEIKTFLEKVNEIGPIKFGGIGGPGSLVMAGMGAGLGSMLGPAGAVAGAVGAGAMPKLIADGITRSPATRNFILKSLQSGKGKISDPSLFANVLGSLLARTPELEGD